jgi:ketosteroid isomerase-like protein
MTTPRTPSETVAAAYEAFATGDVPGLLAMLADDVSLEDHGVPSAAQQAGHPLLRLRRGKDEAASFFAEVGALTPYAFTVHEILGHPATGTVAALVTVDFGLPNGGRYQDAEVHVWRVAADGLVTSVRHVVDTAKHLDAHRGVDTTV